MDDKRRLEYEIEVKKQIEMEKMERIRMHIERKNKDRQIDRLVSTYSKENKIENEIKKQEASLRIDNKAERQETLAKELDLINRKEIVDVKRRQLLRENCHELKELEAALRLAYVHKEMAAQIAEKEATELENKMREKYINVKLREAWQEDADYVRQMTEDDMNRKSQLRTALQDQLMFKENQKRFEYEEFLREKKMLDDIAQRVHDEDEREIIKQKAETQRLKQDMEDFKTAQAAWKNNKQKELEEEHKRIQQLLNEQAAKATAAYEEKLALENAKQDVREKIAMKLYEERKKKTDREDIRQELLEEEEKEAIEMRNRMDIEKLMARSADTRESLLRQMDERKERERKQSELDTKYKIELEAKIAEDVRKEQLKEEQNQLKMTHHRKYIEAMMDERRRRNAEEMSRKVEIAERERIEQLAKAKLVNEERMRILQEHGPKVLSYIPKGVLKDDDWKSLGFNSLAEMRDAAKK